jgi:hypothetical protein
MPASDDAENLDPVGRVLAGGELKQVARSRALAISETCLFGSR